MPRYQVGDEVIVNASSDPDSTFITVADLYRIPVLALLLVLFAVAVTVVGGWRGVRSLIALALTLAVIVKIVVPLILAGWDPVWVAIGAATGVTIVTLLLTEGAHTRTVAAAIGTFASLALVAVPGRGVRPAGPVHHVPRLGGGRLPAGGGPGRHRHRRPVPGRRSSSARWASSTT